MQLAEVSIVLGSLGRLEITTVMVKELLDQFFWRPWGVMISVADIVTKDASGTAKVEAIISRVAHGLNRPFNVINTSSDSNSAKGTNSGQ